MCGKCTIDNFLYAGDVALITFWMCVCERGCIENFLAVGGSVLVANCCNMINQIEKSDSVKQTP